jgi:hypothetical protein
MHKYIIENLYMKIIVKDGKAERSGIFKLFHNLKPIHLNIYLSSFQTDPVEHDGAYVKGSKLSVGTLIKSSAQGSHVMYTCGFPISENKEANMT